MTVQSVLTASAIIAALVGIWNYVRKLVGWVDRQKQQDEDIKAMKEEQGILTYGVLACLKGLREQGCNGPVTDAISKIEKYLNQKAHK